MDGKIHFMFNHKHRDIILGGWDNLVGAYIRREVRRNGWEELKIDIKPYHVEIEVNVIHTNIWRVISTLKRVGLDVMRICDGVVEKLNCDSF